MAALIARVRIGDSMDSVVVVFGIGWIDRDEGDRAPILASRERRRSRRLALGENRGGEDVWDIVGMDRDQAHRPFALDRTQSLHDRARRQTKPAAARNLDCHEIAVLRAAGRITRNAEFAAELLLVDRHQPAAAARNAAENAEHAMLGAIDELDDACAGLLIVHTLYAHERAIADAGDFARPRTTRHDDVKDGNGAVCLFIPFGRPRQKLAVGIAAGDVGKYDARKRPGVMQSPVAGGVGLRGGWLAPGRLACPVGGLLAARLVCLAATPVPARLPFRGRAWGAGPRSALASTSTAASSSVMVSGVLSRGKVALTPSWLTYGP